MNENLSRFRIILAVITWCCQDRLLWIELAGSLPSCAKTLYIYDAKGAFQWVCVRSLTRGNANVLELELYLVLSKLPKVEITGEGGGG